MSQLAPRIFPEITDYGDGMNRNAFFGGVVLATCIPIAAFAQIAAPSASPDPIAMCKELRSKTEAAQTDARNAALHGLSPAHRAQVQSIIDRVKAEKLDARTATGQIDDLLTVDEAKAVLAEQDKLHQRMRSLLESRPGVRSEGPGLQTQTMGIVVGPGAGRLPPGPPPMMMFGGPPDMGFSVFATTDGFQCGPSAGQALLRMNVPPERMPLRGP
jgi:hypothetical protein